MTRDFVAGLACLAISLVLLAATRGLPEASILVPIGPGAYPRVVLGITAVLSALLLWNGWRARRSTALQPSPRQGSEASGVAEKNYGLVLAAFAVFGSYTLLLPYLGFRIATLLFVAAMQALLEPPRSARAWLVLIVVALTTALGAHAVFERGLSVLLPRGAWTAF